MRRNRRTAGATRTQIVLLVVIAITLVGVLAFPGLTGGPSDDEPMLNPAFASANAPQPAPAAAPTPAPAPRVAMPDTGPYQRPTGRPVDAPQETVATTENGDLTLEMKLRWGDAVAGANVPAVVRFANAGRKTFDLPAAGEPHPTLAIVVLDAEGNEVRRVVESGPDPYPRRTVTLGPGAVCEMPLLVVSGDDAPLPAGEYSCYAEMRRDPAWARLGLAFWTAPNGPVRSPQVTFKLTAPK